MSEFAVDGGALKKMIARARKKPLSFGFNPGKSPGEHMLGLDKRKSPELIGRSVKASGPGVKVAFGTCEVDAKVLTMTCEKVVPMMAKRVKLFLKFNKVMLNVCILGPDGAVLEEDIEEFGDDVDSPGGTDTARAAPEPQRGVDDGPEVPEAATAAKPAELDGRAGALAVRLQTLRPGIATAPDAVRQKLIDAMAGVVAMIRGRKFDDATEALGKLETIVARVAAPTPEADPQVAKLEQAAGMIAQAVAKLPEGAARQALESRLADIGGMIAAGDVAASVAAIKDVQSALKNPEPATVDTAHQQRELVALIGQIKEISTAGPGRTKEMVALAQQASAALKAGETAQADGLIAELRSAVSAGASPPEKVLGIWRDARDETGVQLGQLQDAMKNSGLSLFERIADRGLNSITETRLVSLQVGLMEVDAAQGEARDKAVDKASAAVSEMRDFLNTNPVLPLLEDNPMKIPLTLRATLGRALDDIDRALAA